MKKQEAVRISILNAWQDYVKDLILKSSGSSYLVHIRLIL